MVDGVELPKKIMIKLKNNICCISLKMEIVNLKVENFRCQLELENI